MAVFKFQNKKGPKCFIDHRRSRSRGETILYIHKTVRGQEQSPNSGSILTQRGKVPNKQAPEGRKEVALSIGNGRLRALSK